MERVGDLMLKRAIFFAFMMIFFLPGNSLAAVSMDTKAIPDNQAASASVNTKSAADSTQSTAVQDENKDNIPVKKRFIEILKDNDYSYYLDMDSARWVTCPHGTEQILEVWIKLVQDTNTGSVRATDKGNGIQPSISADENSYSYSDHYYLEHYYIRPAKEQIQFLSELEITGRPSNAISERAYNEANWENLIPDSIEDEIYHGVMKHIKELPKKKSTGEKSSLRDMVDEYLRISL